MIPINIMETKQINLRLNKNLIKALEKHTKYKGYSSIQETIKQITREKLLDEDFLTEKEEKINNNLYFKLITFILI